MAALCTTRISFKTLGCGVAAVAPLQAGASLTQTTDQEFQEIVVTATGQSQSLSRAWVSVSASTQENMDQTGVKSFEELAAFYRVSASMPAPIQSLAR